MKNLNLAANKLTDLIEGKYRDITPSPWGMDEYNHFDETFLHPLSEGEKITVFCITYANIKEDSELKENIKKLFYLSSCFSVPFSKEYMNVLRNEKSEIKQRFFLEKVCYYINDRWSEKSKSALSEQDKNLINTLCEKYNLSSPFPNKC